MDIFKKNYFELFNLPIQIEINKKDLDSRLKFLQYKFHPDKFSAGTNSEKRVALQISSHINDAYITLSDLIARIEYILKLNNFVKDESETLKDDSFLVEQLEYSEFLDNYKKNLVDDVSLSDYSTKISHKFSEAIDLVKEEYDNKCFEKMWSYLSRLKFYKKHITEINSFLINK